jgi:rhamnosyl/mannosyltransferase
MGTDILNGRDGSADRPLRVCHLAKFYAPATGGIETHVRALARGLAALDLDVRVVCVNHRDRAGRDVTWSAFTPTPTTEERDGGVRLTRFGRTASLFRFDLCPGLTRLASSLRRWKPDVLHLHVPNPTMTLALAAVAHRAPLVITHHSDVVRQKMLGLALRPFEHAVLRRAAAVVCTSPLYAAGSPLLTQYADKVRVVPFGIDAGPFLHPSPSVLEHARRLRAEHGDPLWLAVGRLVYYKGLHNAVRALPRVPGKLLVIGDGPLEGELRDESKQLGVADRIVWRGRATDDELAGAYRAATAFWFPSNARSEAFGLVQVEAMASGCPVINCAIPASGVPWVSRHDETGLTVPLNDPEAFAAAARDLLERPGLRERLARAGRERAEREFGDGVMAERTLDVYRQALAGARVRQAGAYAGV